MQRNILIYRGRVSGHVQGCLQKSGCRPLEVVGNALSSARWALWRLSGGRYITEGDEPIDFERLGPAIAALPEVPEEDYPEGSGPYGF